MKYYMTMQKVRVVVCSKIKHRQLKMRESLLVAPLFYGAAGVTDLHPVLAECGSDALGDRHDGPTVLVFGLGHLHRGQVQLTTAVTRWRQLSHRRRHSAHAAPTISLHTILLHGDQHYHNASPDLNTLLCVL